MHANTRCQTPVWSSNLKISKSYFAASFESENTQHRWPHWARFFFQLPSLGGYLQWNSSLVEFQRSMFIITTLQSRQYMSLCSFRHWIYRACSRVSTLDVRKLPDRVTCAACTQLVFGSGQASSEKCIARTPMVPVNKPMCCNLQVQRWSSPHQLRLGYRAAHGRYDLKRRAHRQPWWILLEHWCKKTLQAPCLPEMCRRHYSVSLNVWWAIFVVHYRYQQQKHQYHHTKRYVRHSSSFSVTFGWWKIAAAELGLKPSLVQSQVLQKYH